MNFPSGKIIVFEGLDNCFKSTNFETFVRSMKDIYEFARDKYRVISEKFPRYGTQCAVGIEKWLNGSFDRDYMKKFPEAVNSQYSTDRFSYWFESVHGAERNINKLYNSDEYETCFIFDRYNISNAIYNPMVGNDTTVDDLLFDHDTFGIPQADLVIFFRMRDFDILKSLIAEKQNKDANEVDTTFLKQVWDRAEKAISSTEMFKKAGIELRIIEVLDDNNNLKSRDQLAKEVWEQVSEAFGFFTNTDTSDSKYNSFF